MAVKPKDTRPHVIVVEDEQFQRETLVDFLSENGYRTSGVDSGNALRKLVENGGLSQGAARSARRQPVQLPPGACGAGGGSPTRRPAPFYGDQVRRDLDTLLGSDVAAEGNFLVSTYFAPLLQEVVVPWTQSQAAEWRVPLGEPAP